MTVKENIIQKLTETFPSNSFDIISSNALEHHYIINKLLINNKPVDITWTLGTSLDKISFQNYNYATRDDLLNQVLLQHLKVI